MADLYDMSDEDLEAAFQEAKASEEEVDDSGIVEDEEIEEEVVEDSEDTEFEEEDDDVVDEPEDEESDEGEDETEEVEEEEPEDLPEDEDSDDNETDDEVDEEADEESKEDQTEAEETKIEEPVQPVNHKFKANGMEYEFSNNEIMEQFPKIFGQAMDYTKKTQAMKPWRKTIDALETAKLSHDDVSLAIDVLRGDTSAIQEVLKRQGIDALDLNTEEDKVFTPNDYGRDEKSLAIQDVIDDISVDPEYATTNQVLAKEWDDASWETMAKDPEMIRLLHTDVKSGVYDALKPVAAKLKLYDRGMKSDLEYYKDAAIQRHTAGQAEMDRQQSQAEAQRVQAAQELEQNRIAEVKAKQKSAKTVETKAKARKAAAPVRKKAGVKKTVDYLDESDEAFEDWYNNLQDQS